MRLVIREALDGHEDGRIGDVLIIALRESHLPEDGIVVTEEVDEEDTPEHWACSFNTRAYSVAELKDLIVADQALRREAHKRRLVDATMSRLSGAAHVNTQPVTA